MAPLDSRSPRRLSRTASRPSQPLRSTHPRAFNLASPGAGRRAAAVVAALALAVAGCGDDPEDESTASTTSTTEAAASTTTIASTASTTTTTAHAAEFPATAVAATWGGQLVVLSTATGEATLVIDDRYSDLDAPAPEGGHWLVVQVVLGQDGRIVVETCCEPAAGHIGRYEIAPDAEEEPLVDGMAPSLSPDGSTLLFGVVQTGIAFVEPPDRQPVHIGPPAAPATQFEATTWLDDRTVAYTEVDHRGDESTTVIRTHNVGAVDLTGDDVLAETTEPWVQLATRGDGTLVWASRDVGVAHIVAPDTGDEIATFDLGGPMSDIAYDATGTWLLVVGQDGDLRWFGGGRSGTIPGRYTAAAW